jgi:hypothetical protein
MPAPTGDLGCIRRSPDPREQQERRISPNRDGGSRSVTVSKTFELLD